MVNKSEYPWYQLKYSIAEFMIPKLEEYKHNFIESGKSIPTWVGEISKEEYSEQEINLLTEEWLQKLDEMIISFKMVLNYATGDDSNIAYNEDTIQQGLDLFARYYQNLWG